MPPAGYVVHGIAFAQRASCDTCVLATHTQEPCLITASGEKITSTQAIARFGGSFGARSPHGAVIRVVSFVVHCCMQLRLMARAITCTQPPTRWAIGQARDIGCI